ncbi:MAG TPA: selenide, water dikinase SelD [Rhodobacteraceae bacterium]|nr:selenide, water dikinase SelD [Paracoccaceae bacterium]
MHTPIPLIRDVVLIGGGHTHALVARMFGMKPMAGARLTVINPAPTAPYSGMLPGYIAGHYARMDLEIDLVRLARFAGARLVLGQVTGIDRVARRVQVAGQADIAYDIASVNVGITTEAPTIPGFTENALGAKPLARYTTEWERFLADATAGRRTPDVVVIGGGVAGVELSLAMMHHLKTNGVANASVTILERADTPLRGIGKGARKALLHHIQRLGVVLKTNAEVTHIARDQVHLADGTSIPKSFCVGSTTARPHDWLRDTDLTNDRGFIDVGETLQTLADPLIYAAGDCADLTHAPRPKAGVYAVREAPILFHNLRAELTDGQRKAYTPQKTFLKLIQTGGKGAIADKAGLRLDGPLLWKWKNHIDLKFMRQFEEYPEMPAPTLPRDVAQGVREEMGDVPLCGGCGAKVAPADLQTVLQTLPATARKDVLSGPGDDAAVLACGDGRQVLTTDHLRAFVSDHYRMARITAIHAMGDIWAMGAKPQAALASIILPRMAAKPQAETLREIMQAATETFGAAGAEVVGGHSSQGAELTIGFFVTGLAGKRTVSNRGAQAGDVLILTKPIGTGTILAAEMRLLAEGGWVEAAYRMMERPMDTAAGILAPVAHAMTDITGFGLAGHLDVMLRGSGVGATLNLADIPLLDGAATLADQGVRSTIWAANRAAVQMQAEMESAPEILLFDPQTAGGLLAAVPAAQAKTILAKLLDAGEPAVIIGEVTDGSGITLS